MNTVKSPTRAGRTPLAASASQKLLIKGSESSSSTSEKNKGIKPTANDKSKILSSAKSNFLNSTDQKQIKSPLKRCSTPSPEKSKLIVEHLLSPTSLMKAGLCSPPKKKPKLWKSKWQLATLSGPASSSGKRKKASEASRLLDDEGVIQMLDRVPNVYGDVPKVPGTTNSRLARARSAANKAIKASSNQQAAIKQKQQAKKDRLSSKDEKTPVDVRGSLSPLVRRHQSPMTSPVLVKIEGSPSKIKDMSGGSSSGFTSPRRASRVGGGDVLGYHQQLQHVRNLVKEGAGTSANTSKNHIIKNEDCFSYLGDLPADLLDSVTNCDIRYSLPGQGLPLDPTRPEQASKSTKNHSVTSPTSSKSGAAVNQEAKTKGTSKSPSNHPMVSVKQEPVEPSHNTTSTESSYNSIAGGRQSYNAARRYQSDENEQRMAEARRCLQQNDRTAATMASPVKSPGAFTEIYVRLYENFAQVTFGPGKSKLSQSLGPAAMDEIIQLLDFVSSTRMYHAVLLTGLGNIFCQGIDLFYLCHDNQEKRKELASEMAVALERLILSLANFSKTLIAAVNGETTGLGLAILPFCDIVYASEKATFRSFSSRLGHIAEGGLSISLASRRSAKLKEFILFGRELTSEELMSEGLINHIFLSGRLMEETIPRVRMLCMKNPVGIQCNKALLNSSLREEIEAKLGGETRLLTEIWSTKEFWKNLVNFVTNNKDLKLQKNIKS